MCLLQAANCEAEGELHSVIGFAFSSFDLVFDILVLLNLKIACLRLNSIVATYFHRRLSYSDCCYFVFRQNLLL